MRGRTDADTAREAAFLADCPLLRAWAIAPGAVRTLVFAQPDVELRALPGPDAGGADVPVALDRPLEPLHQQTIADFGVELLDGKSQLELTCIDDNTNKDTAALGSRYPEHRQLWQVGMSEGRNRQIRRTFSALGYRVTFLKRIQFDNILLGDLPEGKWEELPERPVA